MRVGIIGGGGISDTHARAVQAIDGLAVAAVYGANAARVGALAAEAGAAAYDDFDRFLAHGLDFVIIGSPSAQHADQAIAAARHGLHVLVEKPIDVTTAKVDALLETVDRAGVKIGVCFQDRLQPDIHATKAFLDAGKLGRPVLASGRVKWYRPPEYYAGSRWRGKLALDGGGALMNQAIHTVDLLLWLFGPVTRVYASIATRVHAIEVEDTAVAALEFASGALGTIEATTSVYPGYARRVELTGGDGTIVIEHDRVVHSDLRSGDPGVVSNAAGDANASASSAKVSDTRAHQRIIRDFVHAIETGGTPICDGREGRRSVALIEAIYQSAKTHLPVELPVDVAPGVRPT
jgi:UDP-N-acetyl-2-amino-2-deoxyglucuronate dehydrogenase